MDVLRKEINSIYERQNLDAEKLESAVVEDCRRKIETIVSIDNNCRVITDASTDSCYIYGGRLASLIGLCDTSIYAQKMDSSDEDVIYDRIHPEDLVDKRMLELYFFKYVDALPDNEKQGYMATCHFRIRNRCGVYIFVDNSTQVMHLSPNGKIWLILCCYSLSPIQEPLPGIASCIINNTTGKITEVSLSDRRSHILTDREKMVLNLIKEGKLSKQIADILGISIHTVNRHRQNILEKLSVGTSAEAVMAASIMKIL